jgi:dolichol-phosphate mannosyltransferase
MSDTSSQAPLLSVIVPCFNEEAVVAECQRRLAGILNSLDNLEYEIIYIDDGSRDGTFEILKTLHAGDPQRVKVLRFSRNFGHQVAVTAGVEHARGEGVIVIDADLQDPPEVIPEMVAAWRSGAHVVYGKRVRRDGDSLFKRMTARGFYRLMNWVSDCRIPTNTGDFRLMDRAVVDAFLAMPERDRFIRGMVSWTGFVQQPVYIHRQPRFAGKTKYPLYRMLKFAADGIFSFSRKPLKIATGMGFIASGIALLGICYALVLRLFTSIWVTGWTALFMAILFLGGVQLICLGIIGEYVGRIYGEVKHRPLYLVQETLGLRK